MLKCFIAQLHQNRITPLIPAKWYCWDFLLDHPNYFFKFNFHPIALTSDIILNQLRNVACAEISSFNDEPE